MSEQAQLTRVVCALLGSTNYSCLSRETITAIVNQARDVVAEINREAPCKTQ